ncbi:MAG: iron-sulfur cluster assembly accessory protein [Planctomycetia bacterium]|nr:iron-sulfur cluster assembly accessory protein [Planctomycetia bacterium]
MSAVAESKPQTSVNPPITVTERAAEEVRRIVDEQRAAGVLAPEERVYLRVSVKGGGCSGFQNKLDLDPNYNEKSDELFEVNGVGVVADRKSLLYISGATVDFHNDLNKRGFSVSNPNAKTTCGCGSSFSV